MCLVQGAQRLWRLVREAEGFSLDGCKKQCTVMALRKFVRKITQSSGGWGVGPRHRSGEGDLMKGKWPETHSFMGNPYLAYLEIDKFPC